VPRITLSITDEQLSRLTRLNDALNRRARCANPDGKGTSIESTVNTALEYGMQELRRAWYSQELSAFGEPFIAPSKARPPA
jgi:hypothetical protein